MSFTRVFFLKKNNEITIVFLDIGKVDKTGYLSESICFTSVAIVASCQITTSWYLVMDLPFTRIIYALMG